MHSCIRPDSCIQKIPSSVVIILRRHIERNGESALVMLIFVFNLVIFIYIEYSFTIR